MIALDTETHLIGPGPMQTPPLVCLSYAFGSRGPSGVMHRTDPVLLRFIRAAIQNPHVGHNWAYDVGVMWAAHPELIAPTIEAYELDLVTDTMLRGKLLDVAQGMRKWRYDSSGQATRSTYSLAVLTKVAGLAPKDANDPWRLRYSELHNVPVDSWPIEAFKYAEGDALLTLALWEWQRAEASRVEVKLGLAPGSLLASEHREARGHLWLNLSAQHGIVTDADAIAQLERDLIVERDGLAKSLIDAGLMTWTEKGGFRRKAKVAAERQEYAYESTDRPVPRTAKGNVSLARAQCKDSGDDDLDAYSAYGACNSLLSKDIPALRDPAKGGGALIHPYIDSILETGRVAYSKPNMVNLPRRPGVRECLVARPGTVYLAADFAGFELATLAQVCLDLLGRSALADMLNAGIDPHLVIASQIQGVSYEAAKAAWKDEKATGLKAGPWDNARQTGKVANFGLPGGLGAATLVHYALQSYGVRIAESEARTLKETWLRTFPEMWDYFQHVSDQEAEDRPLVQLRSGRVRGGATWCARCNSYFQGLAADIAKDVGWTVLREQRLPGPSVPYGTALYGTRTVLFVHDEYVLEVPYVSSGPTTLSAAAKRLETVMVEGARKWLPGVRLGVECTAMRRYSKKPGPGNRIEIEAL